MDKLISSGFMVATVLLVTLGIVKVIEWQVDNGSEATGIALTAAGVIVLWILTAATM